MKILTINKYNYIKGGSERCLFETSKLLHSRGHKIIPFAMKSDQNVNKEYEQYFVDHIEFNGLSTFQKICNAPKIIGRIIYSRHSQKKIEQLIVDENPDIAHLHMIDHQISPSILKTLKKYNIPAVQSVHQYKLVCPNYRFYIPQKKEVCERCLSGCFYNAVLQKCHKSSYMASFLIFLESSIHKRLKLYMNIDYFITPSEFMQRKLIEGGVPKEKVIYIPHFLQIGEYQPSYTYEDYFVYLGRLSEEKGLMTLLSAMKGIKRSKLKIIGDGPQKSKLEKFIIENFFSNVELLGRKSGEELKSLISKSMFMVIPSEWYENAPMVIYESFAMAKPVIGADIGGISELIMSGINGWLFEPGNVEELKIHINYFLDHREDIPEFGRAARKLVESNFTENVYYDSIMKVYQSLIS